MIHSKLAAAGNSPVTKHEGVVRGTGRHHHWASSALAALHRADRRAQRFFNAQAQVRGRKVDTPACGWQRYDSFC